MPHLLKKLSTGFPSDSAWKTYKALHFWSPSSPCFPSAFIPTLPSTLLLQSQFSDAPWKHPMHSSMWTFSLALPSAWNIQFKWSQAHLLTSTSVFKYYFTWPLHWKLYSLTHNFYFTFLFHFSPSHFYLLISYTINSKFFAICYTQAHTAESMLHEERNVSILFTVIYPVLVECLEHSRYLSIRWMDDFNTLTRCSILFYTYLYMQVCHLLFWLSSIAQIMASTRWVSTLNTNWIELQYI